MGEKLQHEINIPMITLKRRVLIEETTLYLANRGLYLIKGKNGTGKTLLLKNIFFQLQSKNENVIYVDQSNDQVLSRIGILENIAMTTDEQELLKTKDWLYYSGFDYLLKLTPAKVSGGERRMISLLRGFYSNADIILLDEPTNDLDYQKVETLLSIIEDLSKQKTMIIVSHDDRFDQLSDVIYQLENRQLMVLKNRTITDNGLVSTEKEAHPALDVNLINRVFTRRYPSYLLLILFTFVSFISMHLLLDIKTNEIPYMADNQVDIFSRTSSFYKGVDEGALPIQFLSMMSGKMKLRELRKEVYRLLNEDGRAISYLPNLESTDKYTIYPIEFIDFEHDQYVYTLDLYLMTYHDTTIYLDQVDTSKYFQHPELRINLDEELSPTIYPLDPDQFFLLEFPKNEFGSSTQLSYLIITYSDHETFIDLIQDPYFFELYHGNFYIISNETIDLVNHSLSFIGMRILLIFFSVSFIIVILFELVFSYLYFRLHHSALKVLINYGYRREIFQNVLLKKYQLNRFSLLLSIMVVLYNFLLFYLNTNQIQLGYILVSVLFLIGTSLFSLLSRIIVKNTMDKRYHWRYR